MKWIDETPRFPRQHTICGVPVSDGEFWTLAALAVAGALLIILAGHVAVRGLVWVLEGWK